MKADQRAQTRSELVQQLQRMLFWHEQNRRLLACEIHDGVIQDATAAHMHLQMLIEKGLIPPGPIRDEIDQATALIRRAVGEARQLVGGLPPAVPSERGIVPAIEALIAEQPEGGPTIQFLPDVRTEQLDPLLERAVYRIVQEGIANARRHSKSDRVEIRLTELRKRLSVEIRDWGIGFDPSTVPRDRHGLRGLHERARLLQGRIVITSRPGEGTRIRVELPLVPRRESWRGTGTDMNDRSYE